MCESSEDKDKSDKVVTNYTSSDQSVTPIYNGKTQPETIFEKFVEDLGNTHPNTWSHIKNDK